MLVQDSIRDAFTDKLMTLAKSAKIGDPMQPVGDSHWIADNVVVGNSGMEEPIDFASGHDLGAVGEGDHQIAGTPQGTQTQRKRHNANAKPAAQPISLIHHAYAPRFHRPRQTPLVLSR